MLLFTVAATAAQGAGEPVRRQHTMEEVLSLPADNVRDALESTDRPVADRTRDAIENGEAILRESAIARGMRVADLRAGDGYLSQLAVAAVRRGRVWGNNDPASLDAATAEAWKVRLADPSMADVARLDNPLTFPLPAYAFGQNIVFSRGAYHDAVARGVDRAAMNKAVFEATTAGGLYVIVDARADDEAEPQAAAALCRVPEKLVRSEVEAAGFRFVRASTSLRTEADRAGSPACEKPASRPLDRFLLIFEKPR